MPPSLQNLNLNQPITPSLKPSLLACTSSGGFYGNAEQVSEFYHMLLTGKLLTENSLEMMKEYSKTFWLGMGLTRYEDDSLGHGGVLTGYNSRTVHKNGVTISIMSNMCTLSDAYKPTPLDLATPLFPKIITIVRDVIAQHYPQQKLAAEMPRCDNNRPESQQASAISLG